MSTSGVNAGLESPMFPQGMSPTEFCMSGGKALFTGDNCRPKRSIDRMRSKIAQTPLMGLRPVAVTASAGKNQCHRREPPGQKNKNSKQQRR